MNKFILLIYVTLFLSGMELPESKQIQQYEVEIALIFFGSSTCQASNDPSIPGVFEKLKNRLNKYASDNELNFKSIGISIDQNINKGVSYLNKIDTFDEISVGPNRNIASQEYVYKNSIIVSPQILVVVRYFNSDKPELKNIITSETVVHKAVGAYGIHLTNINFEELKSRINESLINL